jgi:hypothetical protein
MENEYSNRRINKHPFLSNGQYTRSRGRRALGRPRRRWVDNIKMDLREIGWDGMGWIDLA